MSKIFWFDVETTGFDPEQQDIIQLAFLIEIDREVREEHNMFMQPFNYETIDQEALDVNKRTIEEIRTFPPPEVAYQELISILGRYVDRYDRSDKFQPAGYKVSFDLEFLKQFFLKNHDVYFGSWFNYKIIDPLSILYFLHGFGHCSLTDYKLETACNHFDIPLDAHDALNDIRATRELTQRIHSDYISP